MRLLLLRPSAKLRVASIMDDFKHEILLSNVNTLLGTIFVASFAFGAGLLIWNAAFGTNPLEKALYAEIYLSKSN